MNRQHMRLQTAATILAGIWATPATAPPDIAKRALQDADELIALVEQAGPLTEAKSAESAENIGRAPRLYVWDDPDGIRRVYTAFAEAAAEITKDAVLRERERIIAQLAEGITVPAGFPFQAKVLDWNTTTQGLQIAAPFLRAVLEPK